LNFPSQSSADDPTPDSPIPRRKKASPETNGNGVPAPEVVANGNGHEITKANAKRPASEVEAAEPQRKRTKTQFNGATDNDIVVIEATDGAIVIDDDWITWIVIIFCGSYGVQMYRYFAIWNMTGSHGTQTPIEIQYTIVCVFIYGQKDGGIGNIWGFPKTFKGYGV
jgi:hypothetical protein